MYTKYIHKFSLQVSQVEKGGHRRPYKLRLNMRVGSEGSKHNHGSSRVGSGRVGSSQEVFKLSRIGPGQGHPDPIRPASCDPTGAKP